MKISIANDFAEYSFELTGIDDMSIYAVYTVIKNSFPRPKFSKLIMKSGDEIPF